MKYMYLSCQRSAWICMIALWLVTLSNLAYAQQKAGIEAGVLRIKVTEALATQLEHARMTRNAGNVLLTGIQSIDRANLQFKVSGMKRVFRYAGKFEERHRRYGLHRWYEIRMDKAAPVLSALAAYKAIEQIEYAEPVHTKAIIGSERSDYGPRRVDVKTMATLPGASNDPLLANQWHYNNTGQAGGTPGSDISLFQAWGIETGSSNVIVAVTDGGAQVDHPDLVANMWINTGEVPGNGVDDDNNGYIDDINGYGFGDDTGEIAPDDHGTHTSGTVAATTNNGIGVAGVAGGSGVGDGARIMSCAAFGAVGTGGFEDTYVYGADNGAVISQNSWGYTIPGTFDQVVLDAIDYFIAEAGKDQDGNQIGPMKGGIVIFAAGNDDSDAPHYPGFYDHTLAIGAVNNQDKKAWYSNFGDWVDMSAPGGETFVNNDPKGVLSTISNGQYAYFQGTSMACPHVSGVAALIVSKFGGPGLTPEMVRGRLTQLVDDIDDIDPDFAGLLGSGRLNAFKALQENDGSSPEVIDDLAASAAGITTVTLTWTSPADPGNGSASIYDIRYATTPITSDNFESATPVSDPPVPLPAGASESFTITGLSPSTTYYFAIKAADFFGNFSDISNVVQQATNAAPEISVSPDALTANLQTAETTVLALTIANNGEGPLNYIFDNQDDSDNFATASPGSGTVAPGESVNVDVTVDANNLLAGTYEQDLVIISNDPLQDTVIVPVTLNVINNGEPIASVSPDSLDFGDVFEGGKKTLWALVHNAGSDTLTITGVSSDNPEFEVESVTKVAPFGDGTVSISYLPSGLGADEGEVTISTDDPAHPTLTVAVKGNGVEAPDIVVSPESLSATLNTDKTSTQTLTVSNPGASNLEFSVAVSASGPATVSSSKTITVPSGGASASSAAQKQSASVKKYSSQVRLKSVGTTASKIKVLIVTPDDDVTDLAAILNGYDDIQADIFPSASLPTIAPGDLAPYDVVITTNNSQWLGGGGIEPAAIGDLLADYIDQGGKVIANQFAYSYDAWKMEGRFIDEQYGPFIPSTTDALIDVALGEILDPSHPIIEGVEELIYSGYVQDVTLAPGATAIANWDTGDLFLAANSNVVALNLLPSLGNGGGLQWEGDLPILYQNAIHYLVQSSFVTVAPTEGIVAPGEQLDLEVTFDAAHLDAGVYAASIDIHNNVPNKELVSVPAVLTVLGPEFIADPADLYVELEKQQTETRTVVIKNNGPDDHTFTVSVQGGIFSTSAVAKKASEPAVNGGAAASTSSEKIKQNSSGRKKAFQVTKESISLSNPNGRMAARTAVVQTSFGLYATDFEGFALGNVSGQEGWFGQFGNWTIESENPLSGAQHFRGLADGLGESLAATPTVSIGSESKSTVTMKVNLQGSGVTWDIIPQSPTAGFINTAIEFGADGSISAFTDDGAGGGVLDPISVALPTGYFDLTIEMDKDSAYFNIYFDDVKVYTGQGFAGAIEEVIIGSLMEEEGPTLDIDDIQIIDGVKEPGASFLTVSPLSGNLPSGGSIELTVKFDADDLEFGKYSSAINVDFDGGGKLVIPAVMRVVGDPAIDVDPTVLQAAVDYKEDTVRYITIANTGGRPLEYGLQVIGAGTDLSKLPPSPVNKSANWASDKRAVDKKAKDDRLSKALPKKSATVELFAGTTLFSEDFEDASFPPSAWEVVDNTGTGVVWSFAADAGEGNYAGTGEAATSSSDVFGVAEFDTELITPVISTAGYKNIVVQYNANYQNVGNLDFLDLDIQVDGGSWTTVLSWNEDHGSFRGTPGEYIAVALDDYLESASSFRLRWHYYDPNDEDWDWYAQIDDVVVLGDPRAWLRVSPASGTVAVGESELIEATFDAEDIDPGFYVSGILVSSNAPADPLIGIVASLEVREPAVISVEPESLTQELFSGATATQTLLVKNSGESALKFSFGNTPVPTAVKPSVKQERREPVIRRTSRVQNAVNLRDARAISSGISKSATSPLYVTGFEEFATGDIDGQEGWNGTWANWTVEVDNPFEGEQHFRGLADGLGETLAFSPVVAIGSDAVSSTAMELFVTGEGVTWEVIPQSNTAEFVNTRFQIAPDRSLSALVQDSVGNVYYQFIDATLPEGYFELRIDVERATSIFTIYIDSNPVFTGQGFAGDIEQVVLYSLMEEEGPTFDMDNFALYDGPGVAPWLRVNPTAGIVPAGGSAAITVTFSARDLAAGVYWDTLRISSNDPEHSPLWVPAKLTVIQNIPPVLDSISGASVIEMGSLDVTFTASDGDGEAVSIALQNPPAFITLLSSADGTVTYRIKPALGDGGDYNIPVVATDERGATDTEIFYLTVVPYGVENFSLVYFKSGQVVETFTDSLTLDVAHPDFAKLTIRANTNPAKIGSVRFWVDGSEATMENIEPYDLNPDVLPDLTGGEHWLKAEAFTKTRARGDQGKSQEAVVLVINSTAVNAFTVIKTNRTPLMGLADGGVIDISQKDYKQINIAAGMGTGVVKSVVFELNGEVVRTDNKIPFVLSGSGPNQDLPWNPAPGWYTLTATPYALTNGNGVAGIPLTINFQVINGAVPTDAMARNGGKDSENALAEEGGEPTWSVYPVPVYDELHLHLKGKVEGDVGVMIRNSQGIPMFREQGGAPVFRDYTISTLKLGLPAGVYVLQVQYANGKREVRKFIKQ